MQMPSSRVLITVSIVSGLAAIGGGFFIYFGIYNVSALAQHTAPVYTLLQVALERSIASRSDDITVPDLSSLNKAEGMRLYARHCEQCHGAPGAGPASFSLGMLPAPTAAAILARERSPAEIFWSVKNGIKMTGMPAWDYRLSDGQIWEIVALVKDMSDFTAEEYLSLRARSLAEPVDREPLRDRDVAGADSSPKKSGPVERGRLALQQYNCSGCHEIPGVVAARNQVGPPLGGMAQRAFIAGVLKNTDKNMIRWIRFPREVDPHTTMPNLNVSEAHARQMVAYFRSLRVVSEELKHPPPDERKPR